MTLSLLPVSWEGTDFGQSIFGQSIGVCHGGPWREDIKGGAPKGWGPEGVEPRRCGAPKGWVLKGWGLEGVGP